MKKYMRWTLTVAVMGLMVLLTGCDLGLLADIVIPGGNYTDSIRGMIVEADDFTWSNGQPLHFSYLEAGEKLIIALSPFDNSTIKATNYTVQISPAVNALSLKSLQPASASGRVLNLPAESVALTFPEGMSGDAPEKEPAADEVMDYFAYHPGKADSAAEPHTPSAGLQSEKLAALQSGTRDFYVRVDGNASSFQTVRASWVKTSANLEIYVSNDAAVGVSGTVIDRIASEFDNRIYHRVTNFMGTPYDVDHNGRTIILIAPLTYNGSTTGMIGYFDEVNLFDKTDNNYSNEADMFYMNSNVVAKGEMNTICGNLAHEFAHLIFASQKFLANPYGIRFSAQYSDRWLNEGCAVVASHLAGYAGLGSDSRIYDRNFGYFGNPQRDSLLVWESGNEQSNYGSSALFTFYLYEHYQSALKTVLRTSGTVEKAIEDSMDNFSAILRNWMLTNLGDRLSGYSAYRYQSIDLSSMPAMRTVTGPTSLTVKGMGVQYLVIDGPVENLAITMTTNASILNAGYMIVRTQ